MNEPQPTPEALKFWKERAEGFAQRIHAFVLTVNESLPEQYQASTLEECSDHLAEFLGAYQAGLTQQQQTLKCYLWALVAQAGGSVTVTDEVLQRAFTPAAALEVKTAGTETKFTALVQMVKAEVSREGCEGGEG